MDDLFEFGAVAEGEALQDFEPEGAAWWELFGSVVSYSISPSSRTRVG